MDFQNIKFRATLFTDKDIVMDEQWFADANKLMAKFNLVPSVGSAFKIAPNADGGLPVIVNSYFIEFKKLDNSFRVSLMPNRFDVEKLVSYPSVVSPLKDFINETTEIFKNITTLQNTFSRVALAMNVDLSVSNEERKDITKVFIPSDIISSTSPSELFKRVVMKTDYKSDKDEILASMNEVFEFGSTDILREDLPVSIGFDFNSVEDNSPEKISLSYESVLKIAAENIAKYSESTTLSKLIYN